AWNSCSRDKTVLTAKPGLAARASPNSDPSDALHIPTEPSQGCEHLGPPWKTKISGLLKSSRKLWVHERLRGLVQDFSLPWFPSTRAGAGGGGGGEGRGERRKKKEEKKNEKEEEEKKKQVEMEKEEEEEEKKKEQEEEKQEEEKEKEEEKDNEKEEEEQDKKEEEKEKEEEEKEGKRRRREKEEEKENEKEEEEDEKQEEKEMKEEKEEEKENEEEEEEQEEKGCTRYWSEGFGILEKILLLSFISAVILMAILGNLLVMVAVCRDRQLRKIKTNYFIVSLAFADLLVSVLVMPFGAMELVQDNWVYGEMFCLVRTSLDVLLTTASILHLCCISLDRYYAICCQPLVYRNKMTPLRIAVMLGGCWVIPTFISFLPIMQGWNSIGIIDLVTSNSTYCIFMVNKPYAITCSVVAFYIPFLLMVLAYHRIYTLCIIMGCFCLCWAPFFVTNIVDPFINYTVPGKLWTAFLWLGYINSGLNPFLYAFLNKAFRRAFLIILCCGDERYRRPSMLGQSVPCSTTTINGSTHVL
ncbi:5-hydroxytryptamine receptor 4, partial [Lamprotornis superbus]